MKDIIARHRAGEHLGICSVCSAHPLVIEAALRFDLNTNNKVLIEATSNQVNQFGGYTGMTPAHFRDFVLNIAKHVGFPRERLILRITWGLTAGKTNRRKPRWINPLS